MCTLVEYEGGEPTEDILNRQCLNVGIHPYKSENSNLLLNVKYLETLTRILHIPETFGKNLLKILIKSAKSMYELANLVKCFKRNAFAFFRLKKNNKVFILIHPLNHSSQ